MKNFIRSRYLMLCILPVALAVFTTQAFSATGQHLQLHGKNGKVYNVTTDASGKFSFENVEPGTYELVWVLPEGTSPDNTESASIEIQSFSWGATQMGSGGGAGGSGRVTSATTTSTDSDGDGVSSERTKSRSNIQNNRTINTSRSNIKSQRTASEFQKLSNGKGYYVLVLEDVLVSGVTTCQGTCGKMAINEKGLPGEKGTKKGNK